MDEKWREVGDTDNDIVVEVPDAAVVFAGDLVEEGAPPVFNDSFPLDWPSTLDALAATVDGAVVPGTVTSSTEPTSKNRRPSSADELRRRLDIPQERV